MARPASWAALAAAVLAHQWLIHSGVTTHISLPGSVLPLATPPAASVPACAPLPAGVARETLANATVVPGTAHIVGCETPAVSPDGTLYLPDERGVVWALPPGAAAATTIATLPGRPLGAALAGADLIVAAAGAGVFAVDVASRPAPPPRLLAAVAADGRRVEFANGVWPLPDGGALVTDSMDVPPPPPALPGAAWRAYEGSVAALLSGRPSGRLLRVAPGGGAAPAAVVADGLWFANGVVSTDGGATAIVAETHAARLTRVDVATGAATPWVELPGFPDGLALSAGGNVVVAVYGVPPSPAAHADLARRRAVRAVAARLPPALLDRANPPTGLVLTLDASTGSVLRADADARGAVVAGVSAAVPTPDGRVLLGSLSAAGVRSVVF